MAELTDKQALQLWTDYVENIRKQTALMQGENEQQQKKRIKLLEADIVLWCKYHFPNFCYAEFADFQIRYMHRLIEKEEWYEVVMWSRELAKSTITMMVILYLTLTGKKKYVLLISNSSENAERLLMPYKGNLEANQRIINDYGLQELPGQWTSGEFSTRRGVAFRALGAGQSPRGTRNEEARPDVILFDDIDTDEECRNPDIIQNKWKWIEDAAISTRSISRKTTIIFCGNKIAADCCVQRATEFADHTEIINIRDAEGNSSWPQKNSEEDIERILSQKSYASVQKEYYNNPLEEGQTFKEINWGKPVPVDELDFIVSYSDPSTSNNDKPSVKSGKQNSCKVNALVGYAAKTDKYYLYKCFNEHSTNATFIDRMYYLREYVNNRSALYTFIENNGLQNPFFEQVLMPLVYQKAKEHKGGELSVTPDTERKGEKFFRIEADLEPLFRLGRFVFNEEEKGDPHMQRMAAQFISASINSKTLDGPDAVQGAVKEIKKRIGLLKHDSIKAFKRPMNAKRY